MKKIVFVCLGNICRSPMAEFVMKELDQEKSLRIEKSRDIFMGAWKSSSSRYPKDFKEICYFF